MYKLTFEKNNKERLDKFIVANIDEFSRSRIQKFILNGLILVNEKKVSAHHFLKNNDIVSVDIMKSIKQKNKTKSVIGMEVEKIKEPIIITDAPDYLVIEKLAGLVVHHGEAPKKQPALTDWLIKKYPKIKKVGEDPERPGIVHRLDKDVSGLMVIAKSHKMFLHLKIQFQNRRILKEYLALVHGKIARDEGKIEFPLIRSKLTGRMAVASKKEEGRDSLTEFSVIRRFVNYTYLKVVIRTGRTHQIRAHLKAYGHPIVGDKLYYNKNNKPAKIKRPFLHSARLGFSDLSGQWLEFNAKLPIELEKFLQNIA